MEVPHFFSHKYVGMEMLQRGQEEWQMCKIVKDFVSENTAELRQDTSTYFSNVVGSTNTVVRFATLMSKSFLTPTAAVIYLLARACNAHTRVHFVNYTWSTVCNNIPYYVAVEFAAVRDQFILLSSIEQESVEVVVGQLQVCSHDTVDNFDEFEDDNDDVDMDPVQSVCSESSVLRDVTDQCEALYVNECSMTLRRLTWQQCYPQLGCEGFMLGPCITCKLGCLD